MIEGLVLLPWVIEAARRNPDGAGHLADCGKCQERFPVETRQRMACGHEPLVQIRQPWTPASLNHEWSAPEGIPSVCPGYLASLPAVQEVARARFWKANLRDFCGGEQPTEQMFRAIEMLEGAEHEREYWAAKNPEGK